MQPSSIDGITIILLRHVIAIITIIIITIFFTNKDASLQSRTEEREPSFSCWIPLLLLPFAGKFHEFHRDRRSRKSKMKPVGKEQTRNYRDKRDTFVIYESPRCLSTGPIKWMQSWTALPFERDSALLYFLPNLFALRNSIVTRDSILIASSAFCLSRVDS